MAVKLSAIVVVLLAGSALAASPMQNSEKFKQHGILPKTPQAFKYALEQYDLAVKRLQASTGKESNENQKTVHKLAIQGWQNAIDRVASQRHAHVSRLFWYTDLESAKLAAAESGRPILSLRMLGKLTDEFSCANSRFFRSALYANQEISDFLREHFVLHWQSVRPVPKVTIEFGDGRKVERTVTGNSAHYLLTVAGKPLDVLPGLYSPKEFLAWLERAETLHANYTTRPNVVAIETIIFRYHRHRLREIRGQWHQDIEQVAPELLGGEFGRGGYGSGLHKVANLVYIDAYTASHQAVSKRKPEAPIIRAISQKPQQTDRMVTDKLWGMIANHHRGEVALDRQSIKLIRQENPAAAEAGRFAFAKARTEDPVLKIVRNFEDSIALDTVRNKYLLEREIHNWFARGQVSDDIDQLNERVYAELFLTPSSDPWLGLVPPDTYTALDDGGVSLPAVADIGLPTSR